MSEAKPAATAGDDQRTPEDWAKALGPKEAPPHLVASASYLHGWKDHAFHYQTEPLLLTQGDFAAALKAAGDYPTVPPHRPALSKTVADRFKDFQPTPSKADVAKAPEAKAKPAEKAEKKGS
jgi:hypothetical protein